MSRGIELIAEERKRQIEVEGWTADHDENHDAGQLAAAAVCYASEAAYQEGEGMFGVREVGPDIPELWPWDVEWWKPSKDSVRNLVKAGALIAAEIDRIQRYKDIEKNNGFRP